MPCGPGLPTAKRPRDPGAPGMLEWVTLQEPQEAMSPPPPAPARNWDADHPVPIRMQRVPRVYVSEDGVEERAVLAGLLCVAALQVGGEESPVLPWHYPGSGTPTPPTLGLCSLSLMAPVTTHSPRPSTLSCSHLSSTAE